VRLRSSCSEKSRSHSSAPSTPSFHVAGARAGAPRARLHPHSHVTEQVLLAVQVQLAERRVGIVSRIDGYSSVRRGTVHLKAQLVQMKLTSGLLASARSVFGTAQGLFSEGGLAVSTCVRADLRRKLV
jgi:hypothetical protein